jgi:hypothetical protein
MKKGILHIQLVERPSTRRGETQHSTDGRRFDNPVEGLIVVDPGLLVVAASYPASLVTGKSDRWETNSLRILNDRITGEGTYI